MRTFVNQARVSRVALRYGIDYDRGTSKRSPSRVFGDPQLRLLDGYEGAAHMSIPLRAHVPARPQDAPIPANPISQDLADLLAPRIMRTTSRVGRCWLRDESYRRPNGYTYITRMTNGVKKHYLAHRIVFVHYFGVIPEGFTIDHMCERPACVNPKHLQAVTHRQNVLRSRKNYFAVKAREKREREGGAA